MFLQATPIVGVADAALLFREKVGKRRWAVIFVGLVGVVVIIRPGTDSFSMHSVLTILGMLGLLVVNWQAVPFVFLDFKTSVYLLGVVAYSCLMKAMRTGDVSAVTPFRYTRLLFGIAFGALLFDEQLGISMLIGCGLIVVSGLFILWRGKQEEILE